MIRVRAHGGAGPTVLVLHGGPGAPGSAAELARRIEARLDGATRARMAALDPRRAADLAAWGALLGAVTGVDLLPEEAPARLRRPRSPRELGRHAALAG